MFWDLVWIAVVTSKICIKGNGGLVLRKGPAKIPRSHRIITTVLRKTLI